jgi:acyl carrier protein
MDHVEIERLVKEVVQAISESASSQARTSIPETNIASWSSLTQMQAFLALEEKFGIEFAPAEIVPPKSTEHLVKLVRGKLAATPR